MKTKQGAKVKQKKAHGRHAKQGMRKENPQERTH